MFIYLQFSLSYFISHSFVFFFRINQIEFLFFLENHTRDAGEALWSINVNPVILCAYSYPTLTHDPLWPKTLNKIHSDCGLYKGLRGKDFRLVDNQNYQARKSIQMSKTSQTICNIIVLILLDVQIALFVCCYQQTFYQSDLPGLVQS